MPPTPEDEGVARTFGEIRALLAQGPGVAVWRALCAAIEHVDPTRYAEQLEPYLQRALASWPDRLRRADPRWLTQDRSGAPRPAQLSLARRIEARDVPTPEATLTSLARDPLTRPVTWLGARWFLGDGHDLAALWETPMMRGLEVLHASNVDMSQERLPCLIEGATAHAPGLRALMLPHCYLESRALRVLADRQLPLRALDLSGHAFSQVELGEWLASGAIEGLEVLGLGNLELWTPELRALARNPHAAALERLDLWGTHTFTDGVRALAGSPYLSRLRRLSLGSTDDPGLGQSAEIWRALLSLEPGVWPALQTLDLSHAPMQPSQLLVAGARWGGPRRLRLRYNELGTQGVAALLALIEGGALSNVEVVDLRHNGLARAPWARVAEVLSRWPAHIRVIALDDGEHPQHARWRARDEDDDEWSL